MMQEAKRNKTKLRMSQKQTYHNKEPKKIQQKNEKEHDGLLNRQNKFIGDTTTLKENKFHICSKKKINSYFVTLIKN